MKFFVFQFNRSISIMVPICHFTYLNVYTKQEIDELFASCFPLILTSFYYINLQIYQLNNQTGKIPQIL